MSKQIFLTGIVDEWMAEDLRETLTNTKEKQVDIYVSSYGGSVNKGFEIANLIQGLSTKKDIHTYNLSHADSIATVIFLSAAKDKRHIVDSSTLFAHEPRMIIMDEVTQGSADKMSAELDLQKNRIADFYVKNIDSLEKDEAISLMEQETTLTADRMEALGIVSEVLPAFEIAAQRNLISNYKNDKMGLFNSNKKEVVNTLSFDDGTMVAFTGELEQGTELAKVGEIANLEGEHLDSTGRKITVDASNKVATIEEVTTPEAEAVALTAEDVAQIVSDQMDALRNELTSKLDDIRNTKSDGAPPKKDPVNPLPKVEKGSQASARESVNAKLAEIQEKKRNARSLV